MPDSEAGAAYKPLADGDQCFECGFVFDLAISPGIGASVSAGAKEVATLLTGGVVEMRTRRDASTWSPLEYGCHLRDVMLVQRENVLLSRHFDRAKVYTRLVRDQRADFDGWSEQDPIDVARQLTDATAMFLRVISRLEPEHWDRTLQYGDGESVVAELPLRWCAVHTQHEVVHHTLDIRRQLQS